MLEDLIELRRLIVLKQKRKNPHAGRPGEVGGSAPKGVTSAPKPAIQQPQQIQTASGPAESHATGTTAQIDQIQQQLAAKGINEFQKVTDPQDPNIAHLVKETMPFGSKLVEEPGGVDLRWHGLDEISGTVAIEFDPTYDSSKITDEQFSDFIKNNLQNPTNATMISDTALTPDEIESIDVSDLSRGQGYVSGHVSIVPTEDRAADHSHSSEEREWARAYYE